MWAWGLVGKACCRAPRKAGTGRRFRFSTPLRLESTSSAAFLSLTSMDCLIGRANVGDCVPQMAMVGLLQVLQLKAHKKTTRPPWSIEPPKHNSLTNKPS
ncbi:unnamed protein product [Discosporangium mesarthrocarpum]